jgi:hypothetical protein
MTAQQRQDTVIVELAKTSRVIFTMQDRKDLEILRHYNFNELFSDILKKLETKDTTALVRTDSAETKDETVAQHETEDWGTSDDDDYDDSDDEDINWEHNGRRGRTWQSFNLDLGTNNYLMNGKFPDTENASFAVRPWGSWYIGLSSIQRTRIAKKFFLEWGVGINWYNFKFQNDNVVIHKEDDGTHFTLDENPDRSYRKSKLTASYLTASLIPVLDFGDNSQKSRVWDGDGNSFRIGLGPYIGYRVGSHSKIIYKDGGREKDKDRSNFYLNNFRYGARLQVGYRSTDLFFNYDLNELFSEGKGPKLNAFSFGVIF